jgi:hypothetical protein
MVKATDGTVFLSPLPSEEEKEKAICLLRFIL